MQIKLTTRHMETTDALREYVHQRLEQHFAEFPRVEFVHAILDVEKYRHSAEIVVQGNNHIRVESKVTDEDMYAAIDKVVDKAGRQLRRSRDKMLDHHRSRERLSDLSLPQDEHSTVLPVE